MYDTLAPYSADPHQTPGEGGGGANDQSRCLFLKANSIWLLAWLERLDFLDTQWPMHWKDTAQTDHLLWLCNFGSEFH